MIVQSNKFLLRKNAVKESVFIYLKKRIEILELHIQQNYIQNQSTIKDFAVSQKSLLQIRIYSGE